MPRFYIAPNSGAKGFWVNAKNKKAAVAKGYWKRKKKKGYGRGFTVRGWHK